MLNNRLVTENANNTNFGELEFLWLELTNKCNLQCIHCYADSSPYSPLREGLSTKDWKNILRESRNLGCRKVQFIGGEPLLYPELDSLICEATKCDYSYIEVYTNATRLDPWKAACFKQHNVRIAVSFYSHNADIHEAITKQKGSFRKTVRGIKTAVDYGLKIRASIIVMEENHDIENTKLCLKELGVSTIGIDRKRYFGRGAVGCGKKSEVDPYKELCGNCGKGQIAINARGEVSPCVFSHFIDIGNINSGLEALLGSKKLISFRNKLRRENKLEDKVYGKCGPSRHPVPAPCAPVKRWEHEFRYNGNVPATVDCGPDYQCQPNFACEPYDYCEPDVD